MQEIMIMKIEIYILFIFLILNLKKKKLAHNVYRLRNNFQQASFLLTISNSQSFF